jgi:hypothetical protein
MRSDPFCSYLPAAWQNRRKSVTRQIAVERTQAGVH